MSPDGAGGDRAARFTELFQGYYATVAGFLVRRTADRQDAEDLANATFASAWRRLDELPREGDPKAWLLAMAKGHLANHWRGTRRQRRLFGRLAKADWAPPAPMGGGIALEAFQRLRPREQEVLRLAAWDDLTSAEAADVLGCSVNAYNVRLHRARRSLKTQYERLRAVDSPKEWGDRTPRGGEP